MEKLQQWLSTVVPTLRAAGTPHHSLQLSANRTQRRVTPLGIWLGTTTLLA